jgi:hypothetical protein
LLTGYYELLASPFEHSNFHEFHTTYFSFPALNILSVAWGMKKTNSLFYSNKLCDVQYRPKMYIQCGNKSPQHVKFICSHSMYHNKEKRKQTHDFVVMSRAVGKQTESNYVWLTKVALFCFICASSVLVLHCVSQVRWILFSLFKFFSPKPFCMQKSQLIIIL